MTGDEASGHEMWPGVLLATFEERLDVLTLLPSLASTADACRALRSATA